jgi:serine/threonine protein kinase
MSSAEPPDPDPFEGSPFKTLKRLGAGGMGEVFLLEHRGMGRRFAGKLLHKHLLLDPRSVERMRIEGQAAGALEHPNIVGVMGVGQTQVGRRPYIITEYLIGRTLREEMAERGAFPVLEAVTYASELLSALSAAHAIGIVHRDIKPDNLFLCDGPPRTLKVLDFGIARVTPESSVVQPLNPWLRTRTGEQIGTPLWQSPEGAMGRHVDARADVYAAALVLYAMLTARGPFDHFGSDSMVLQAHAVEDAEPPSVFAAEPIPLELDRAVLKALAKDPAERFQAAEELRSVLLSVAERLKRSIRSGSGAGEAPCKPGRVAENPVLPQALPEAAPPPRVTVSEEATESPPPARRQPTANVSETPSAAALDQRSVRLVAFLVFVITGAIAAALVALFQKGGGAP